jgi:hypothetical protein
MKKRTPAPKTKTTRTKKTDPDVVNKRYVRAICRDLDGRFDKEAILLVMRDGALAIESPEKIGEAVERLAGKTVDAKIEALEKKVPPAYADLFNQLDDLCRKEQVESIDAAYYLGIAVGRRLGCMRLTLPAVGAR